MQDPLVVPDHYAYCLRLTAPRSAGAAGVLNKFAQHHCYHEAPANSLPHFHAIFWTKEKLTNSQQSNIRTSFRKISMPEATANSLRTQWGKPPSRRYQPVAVTKVKVSTLSALSYASKDSDLVSTTLMPSQIASIPKWTSEKDFKQKQRTQKIETVISMCNSKTFAPFCKEFHDNYYKVFNRYCTNRNLFYRAAHGLGILDFYEYSQAIGLNLDLQVHSSFKDNLYSREKKIDSIVEHLDLFHNIKIPG